MRNKSTFWNDAEDLEARFFLLVAIPENGKVNGALDGSCEQVTGQLYCFRLPFLQLSPSKHYVSRTTALEAQVLGPEAPGDAVTVSVPV